MLSTSSVPTPTPDPPLAFLPSDSDLPFHLRQSTFRLYEPLILQALSLWPEYLIINPAPLRSTTVTARLRDALLGLYRFRWPTTIDMALFDQLYKDLVVTHGDQSVRIGPRRNQARTFDQGFATSLNRATKGIVFDSGKWTHQDLDAACRLLSSRLIVGPIFVKPPLTDDQISRLETTFDIAINSEIDRTTII